jgi:hypothetical protein
METDVARSRKFTIIEMEEFNGTRVFKVSWDGKPFAINWTDVWVQPGDTPRCVRCSGPLRAMLRTCKHAMAVRRYLVRATDAQHSAGPSDNAVSE